MHALIPNFLQFRSISRPTRGSLSSRTLNRLLKKEGLIICFVIRTRICLRPNFSVSLISSCGLACIRLPRNLTMTLPVSYRNILKLHISVSQQNFTDYGCIAVAVLTHGSSDGLLRAKDKPYNETEIIEYFKVHDKPTLVTKPKLLIIQACRGTTLIPGVQVFSKIRKDVGVFEEDVQPYILPGEADLLILHSSYFENPSHRDEVAGSWFVQSLCQKIRELSSTHDLESIMTEVKRDVAINKVHVDLNKATGMYQVNKQMPVTTSTLIRKLYLKRFKDDPVPSTVMHTMESSNHIMTDNPLTPRTPVPYCSCLSNYFLYIRNCLRCYVKDNPTDCIAKVILYQADSFTDEGTIRAEQSDTIQAIHIHLAEKAFYKYMYYLNR